MSNCTPPQINRLFCEELAPLHGSKEPNALAFAAASAVTLLGDQVSHLTVITDPGTLKNTYSVGLPNTSFQGPAIAIAAGALHPSPELGLQLLHHLRPQEWQASSQFSDHVTISADAAYHGPFIRVTAYSKNHKAEVVFDGRYDRMSRCRRDEIPILTQPGSRPTDPLSRQETRTCLSGIPQILAALDSLDAAAYQVVNTALQTNLSFLAANRTYQGYGQAILKGPLGHGNPLYDSIRGHIACAIEAHMRGETQTLYASANSGTSGLIVTLGPYLAAQNMDIQNHDTLLGAIALAHLCHLAIRARIGRNGPLCGGSLGAALGVACAVVYLQGHGERAMNRVVQLIFNTIAGVLCDGAKRSCAMKIANALTVALDSARLAMSDAPELEDEGLAGRNAACSFTRLDHLIRETYQRTNLQLNNFYQTSQKRSFAV